MEDMDRSIAYLMHRIISRVEGAVNMRARASGLRIEEIRVLFRLAAQDYQTMRELAEQTGIETSTLSRLLMRMQRKGTVRKRRQSGDSRTVNVSLTEKGRALAQARQPTFREYEDIILRSFTQEEAQAVKLALIRMLANSAEIPNKVESEYGGAPPRVRSDIGAKQRQSDPIRPPREGPRRRRQAAAPSDRPRAAGSVATDDV